MELTDLEQQRVQKLERLREAGGEPYPRRSHRTHTTAEAIAVHEAVANAETPAPEVTVAGRVISSRVMVRALAGVARAEGPKDRWCSADDSDMVIGPLRDRSRGLR